MVRLTLIFTLLFHVILSFAQDAAQWRGPNRNGIYPETGLLATWPVAGPKLLWHFDQLGEGHGSAAVYDSKIYTSGTEGGNGFVIAFNDTGKQLWKSVFGKEWVENWDGVRGTPMIYEGKVYIMSGYGVVVCLDAETGKKLWQVDFMTEFDGRNIQWGVTENLLAFDNTLICTPGGIDANVIALDKNTGKLIWKCSGNGEKSAYCSPLLVNHNNRRVVVTHTESSILGIDAENGKLLWAHNQPNKYSVHANTPTYFNGQIYCVSGYGKGGVMLKLSQNGESVTELWRDEALDGRMGGVVLLDGKIYGGTDNSKGWVCLDWNTGKELYSSSVLKKGNIISAEGLLYWYSEGGEVALVQPTPTEFKVISSFKVPYGEKQHWAHLVINNKRLFVRHGTSLMVYAIGK